MRGAGARVGTNSITGFVLYVGNIKPHKNLVRLIEAFNELRTADLEDVKLLIIGDEILEAASLAARRYTPSSCTSTCASSATCRRSTRGALSPRSRLRLPVALRGLRAAPARSDGQWHTGGRLERVVAAEVVGDAAVLVDPHDIDSIVDGSAVRTDEPDARRRDAPQGSRTSA
jgi:hypothetical protein